jgi:hypothetical protein
LLIVAFLCILACVSVAIMANLHRALVNNPFEWYLSDIPCGKDKMPLDPNFTPRKTEQIKVTFNIEVKSKEKEISFYCAPFNCESCEGFLAQTWDQYSKATKAKLPSALREDGPTHFCLFPLVLGPVLEENCVKASDRSDGMNDLSYLNFVNCVSLFLEEVADIKFIGHVVIRFLRHAHKPMAMSPDVCFHQCFSLLAYLDGGLLRSKLARPMAAGISIKKNTPRLIPSSTKILPPSVPPSASITLQT